MSVPLDILITLAPLLPASGKVLDQSARISQGAWTQVAQPEVAWMLGSYPQSINRRDIIDLRHKDPVLRRRRVAIASLMWGYGIAGTRWGDSWVGNVSNFLGPSLDPILDRCEAYLADGAIAEAYRLFIHDGRRGIELEKYQGVGFSFITKVLYFLARNSLGDKPAEYPLILDTKVSMALAQMTGFRLLVRPDDYRPRPDSAAYFRYVKAMHAWASRLNVLPEVIEYYLWREASKRRSALWAACQAQHNLNFP